MWITDCTTEDVDSKCKSCDRDDKIIGTDDGRDDGS
jgi:hypothetical protein